MNTLSDTYSYSLIDIWNNVKLPFIAENNKGWLVMITSDPINQRAKYNGRIYGKLQKKFDLLYLTSRTREIFDAEYKIWKFIEIVND